MGCDIADASEFYGRRDVKMGTLIGVSKRMLKKTEMDQELNVVAGMQMGAGSKCEIPWIAVERGWLFISENSAMISYLSPVTSRLRHISTISHSICRSIWELTSFPAKWRENFYTSTLVVTLTT